jgi:hypothetical protein
MIDINELRQLAQAATPGGWYVARGNYVYGCKEVTDGEEEWHPVIACTDDDEVSINFEGNANFIAAANPAVINELLDRIEAAEKDIALKERVIDSLGLALNAAAHERDNLRAEVESWKGLAQQFGNELDTVRAKIAEMEKQEPVAFALYSGWARKAVYLSEIEACEQRDRRQLTADLGGSLEAYRVVPLYPAPGAKGE